MTPVRRRVTGWLVLAAAAIPLIRGLDRRLVPSGPILGTESALVERRLRESFDTPFAATAVLVMADLAVDPASDSGRALTRRIVAPIERHPGVRAIVSPGSSLDTMLVGADRATALALVGLDPTTPGTIGALRDLTAGIAASIRGQHPRVTLRWTGQPALVEDLRITGSAAARRAELTALPITALVAMWAFGSTAGLAIGALAAIVTVALGLGLAGALSFLLPMSPLVRAATSIVGVALSIDYALFLIRGPRGGIDPRQTVLLAGVAVAIGYGGLAFAPTGELRSAAAVGIGVSLVAAAVAITLAPLVPRGPGTGAPTTGWLRWGRLVTRRPGLVLVMAATPLAGLAAAAGHARLLTPLDRWLPAAMESTEALTDLERAGRLSASGTLRILLDLPAGSDVFTPAGWGALWEAGTRLGALPGGAGVRSLATIGTGELIVAREVFPESITRALVSLDRRTAIIDLLPDPRLPRDSATALVRRVRAADPVAISGLAGTRILVAGLPAYALDYAEGIRAVLPAIVLAVSVATWLALTIGLRAPVLATKAVFLNLVVATAAIGATVLVFQDGVGGSLFGREPLGSVLPTVPVVAFGIAFGLGMDYELFLIAAVEAARGDGARGPDAIAIGVATSGRIITRAAAVMGALFLAVATSDLLPLAMIGFALATAVLLDATVVRLALAPALLQIAGRWNWWPRRPDSVA